MCSSTSKAQTRSKPRRPSSAATPPQTPSPRPASASRSCRRTQETGSRLDPDVVVAQGQPRADRSLARPNLEDRPDVAERFQDAGDDAVAQPPVQGQRRMLHGTGPQPAIRARSPAATLAGRNASTARS